MDNDKSLKEQLFGKVVPIKATGGHVVDAQEITAPLEKDNYNSVIHFFCTGCGAYLQANREVAEKTAKLAKAILPKVIEKGMYFEAAGCECCDGDRNKVFLKKI